MLVSTERFINQNNTTSVPLQYCRSTRFADLIRLLVVSCSYKNGKQLSAVNDPSSSFPASFTEEHEAVDDINKEISAKKLETTPLRVLSIVNLKSRHSCAARKQREID